MIMTPIENKKELVYTKTEVDRLIQEVKDEAKEMDAILMAKHNRNATLISMILGAICLALFLDGLLRLLGIAPPFMDLDVNILDKVVERVEEDILPLVQQAKGYIPKI